MSRPTSRIYPGLTEFIRESNLIERIDRPPSKPEVDASVIFMKLPVVSLEDLCTVQSIYAPGKPLRTKPGMNVQVGTHIPDPGSPQISSMLQDILDIAHAEPDAWAVHVAFEDLHPFMDGNGRTGRILWAWQMQRSGQFPFDLPFLHRFYYQTLEHGGR